VSGYILWHQRFEGKI